MERLLGQAAVGDPDLGLGRSCRSGRRHRGRRGAPPAGSGSRRSDAWRPPPHGVLHLAGAIRGLRRARRTRPRARPGAGRDAGTLVARAVGGRGGAQAIAGEARRPGVRSSTPMLTRVGARPACAVPAGQSAPLIGRLPGGGTASSTRRPSAVARAGRSPCTTRRPGTSPGSDGADRCRRHHQPLLADLQERAGPRQVRTDLPLQLGGRQRRVQAPVLAAERPGEGRRRPPAAGRAASVPASHGSSDRQEQPGGQRPPAAPRAPGAVSSPASATRLLRHDRARVEALVHAHERHGRLVVAGQDRRRDRRRAPPARQGDGWRLSAPCGRSRSGGGTIWP